ncbi:MAG: hypothetical protein JSU96_01740 [Acidobacteriota bacterium]|nr:MAG: hypothetical protein JSU96_01740 [Acidobacteriota bacterium]
MFQNRRLRLLLQFVAGIVAVYAMSLLLSQAKEAYVTSTLPDGWAILRPPHEVSALMLDGENLWEGGRDGLFLIDRESSQLLSLPSGTPQLSYVVDILRDREERLWVAASQGAFCLSGGSWRVLGTVEGAPPGAAKSLFEDSSGAIWIGFETGVLKYSDSNQQFFDRDSGLGLDSVDVILEDREGSLWFGSASPTQGGLSRLAGQSWTSFTSKEHLPHNTVNDLLQDRQGRIWVGTGFSRRGGIGLLSQGSWRQLGMEEGLPGEKVRSFFEDSRGRLWVGSEYDGIVIFDDDRHQVLTPEDGLAGWEVKVMVEDPDGVFRMGTEEGISRVESLRTVASFSGVKQ